MARWVAAEVGPDTWATLVAFDDGWVEVPSVGRQLSRARGDLKRSLGMVVLIAAVIGGVVGLNAWFGPATWISVLAAVLLVAVFGFALTVAFRMQQRDDKAAWGDIAQLRSGKAAGTNLRSVPGAPKFRRARSAEQYAGRVQNATLIRAAEVLEVATSRAGPDYTATVRLSSGNSRDYRSPDGNLVTLLVGYAPGGVPRSG